MAVSQQAIDGLRNLFGDRFATSRSVREQHGRDEFWHAKALPDVVVFPETTEQVSQAVKMCSDSQTPIIPFGTGASVEGQIQAIHGGVTIDVMHMNKVLEVNPEDFDYTVEAGVTRKHLNDYIRDTGLFFPIDPGADASVGGKTVTRASGTNAVRYATIKDNVISVKAVLPDSRVIRTATRAKKSSAGLDLTRLFVSWGRRAYSTL